ncbi:hypothetical protein L195_g050545, partial [Trifolium pratense]
ITLKRTWRKLPLKHIIKAFNPSSYPDINLDSLSFSDIAKIREKMFELLPTVVETFVDERDHACVFLLGNGVLPSTVAVECDYFHCCQSHGEVNVLRLRSSCGGAVMWLSSALSYHFKAVEIVHHSVDPRLRGPHYVESAGFLRSVWRSPPEYDLATFRRCVAAYSA